MSTLRITAAEVARSLPALLERLGDRRDEIEIEADGVVLARIVPAVARQNGTLEALFGALGARVQGEVDFADDVDAPLLEPRRARNRWAN